tara:strand:- start:56768 stop:57001 length:234 start_codon:yes stop_codon:yes gene_type:complete
MKKEDISKVFENNNFHYDLEIQLYEKNLIITRSDEKEKYQIKIESYVDALDIQQKLAELVKIRNVHVFGCSPFKLIK